MACPLVTLSPGLTRQMMPAAALTGSSDGIARVLARQAGQGEHLLGQGVRDLHQVIGTVALQGLDRLLHLDGVADRAAQRGIHAGQQGSGGDVMLLADRHHRLRQLSCPRPVLHEGAGADLDVEDEGSGALGDLLRRDRAGDQRDRLDGAGDVAERVEPAVGRSQARAGGGDDAAGLSQRVYGLLRGQAGPEAGDGLELVQGAAGVPEAPAGQLRDRGPAGRHQRSQDQAYLVPHAAGRVLVNGGAGEAAEVQAIAGIDHGGGPGPELLGVKPLEVDGHEQGYRVGHLVRSSLRAARSVLVNAAGSRTSRSTGPVSVSTSSPGPPASSSS
jgi:hypothetical protein